MRQAVGRACKGRDDVGVSARPLPSGVLDDWVVEAGKVFGLNGLVVLYANEDDQPVSKTVYTTVTSRERARLAKGVNVIRNNQSRKGRIWAYEHNLINEREVYAWFQNLVYRQNTELVEVKKDGRKELIENFSGRWNKKLPYGYKVRKAMQDILRTVQSPLMVTLTCSKEKVAAVMPEYTNFDEVTYATVHIGEWIRDFNNRLFKEQRRKLVSASFVGWALEFQGEKGRESDRNVGMPHIHEIFEGSWIGDIRDIQSLWPYGRVDISKHRSKNRSDGLRVANYLTKYVSKGAVGAEGDIVHKGYAFLAFGKGRVFSVRHEKKLDKNEGVFVG